MRQKILALLVVFAVIAPGAAQAQVLKMATGAAIGGLAGSVYVSGLPATAAMVVEAVVATADAIAVSVPVMASGVASAVSAASTPVLLGIVVGGAVGILLFQ